MTAVTIDHVTIRVGEPARSLAFYTSVFDLLGFGGAHVSGDGFDEWNDFSIAAADGERSRTTGFHMGFAAHSRAQIDEWWQALRAAGHADLGEPGLRPEYGPTYYGAFVADPDGNSVEAVHHDSSDQSTGVVDHLWVRVRDLAATSAFYKPTAGAIGIRVRDLPGRVQLITSSGSCSFLAGTPSRNVHLAFGVSRTREVAAFHAAGTAAGGADNGRPGERPEYHPGYHGAYVLDPDGNNVEAVFHDRSGAG